MKEGGDIVDVTEVDPTVPRNMRDFIQGGAPNLTAARNGHFILKRENVKVLAPITNPEKVLCVGMNYKDHCEEQGVPVPEEPVIFSKFNSSIIGPEDDLVYPEETKAFEENAMDYVFGFTVAHDVSARDWQFKNGGQFLLGKSMDGFCPLGPVIIMKEDIKGQGRIPRCLS
nr:hypothetical protein BaRGS_007072 [Batillaria attramentaria]